MLYLYDSIQLPYNPLIFADPLNRVLDQFFKGDNGPFRNYFPMNPNASPCVFVADDDEDDCYLLARAFGEHSPECRLQFTLDGAALLESLAQSEVQPSLILLDLNMPRLDGFEALQRLRQNPLYQATPIVILTTSEAQQDRQRARELGANDFITKPLNAQVLGETVTQLRVTWLLGRCC